MHKIICCLLLWTVAYPLAAQTSLSTLRGRVADTSGAVIPGATVTMVDKETRVTVRTVSTDELGNFEMPDLKLGVYRVSVAHKGFATLVAEDVTLSSSQVRRIDVTLEVGDTATQITVTEGAATIETEEGKLSSNVSAAQYKDLPMPGNAYGSPLPVLATLPNVQSDEGSYNVSFAGQTGAQLAMGMDGVKEETTNTQTVNMESVEEVRMVVVNNSAEYSRVGYYDVISKRGGNAFHGLGSYYNRNSALGARGFYEPEKAHVIYNTINVAGSGPIIKDRTFFYGLWNGERVPGGAFHLANVPTSAMRQGDFSGLLGLDSPTTITDPLTGTPFAGNVIPGGRLNSATTTLQSKYMPTPNLGSPSSLTNNYGFVWPYPDDQFNADVYTVRIDHKISEANSLFGRFSAYLPKYILAGSYPDLFWTRKRQSYSWAIVDTHLLSSSLVNTFTFGGNRDRVSDGESINGHNPVQGNQVVSEIGLTGVNPKGLSAMGFPTMDIAGYSPLSVQPGGVSVARNLTFSDGLIWSNGRHILKAGGEFRTYNNLNGTVPQDTYGYFTFNGSLSNNAYSDFLLGLPFSSQRLDPIVNQTQTSKELGLYITDTIKVSNRLTMDVGLRWDYFFSPSFEDGLQYNWDPATGNVVVPQSAMSKISPLYPASIHVVAGQVVPNPDPHNFAPRISAAYRLTGKTVLRGAYGIFTETLGPYTLSQSGGPFAIGETFFNSVTNGTPAFALPNPFPQGPGEVASQSVSGYSLNTTNGRIHQFNVTLEQEFRDFGLRLSYVGARDRGLNYGLPSLNLGSFNNGSSPGYLDLNKPQPGLAPFTDSMRPYTQYVSTYFDRSNGQTNYNALSFEAKRSIGRVQMNASWTWAKNMVNYSNLENPYAGLLWNRDANPEHRVVLNVAWDLPFGKGARFLSSAPRAVDLVLGGWKLYWIGFFQSGHYFTPFYSGADPSNTNTYGGLPDRIANGNFAPGKRTLDQWFNVAAFTTPAAGHYGNSGTNILEGPGLSSQNLTLAKRFNLTERLHFDLQAVGSNVFNHPNFYSPPANISIPGQAGVIGAGGGQIGFFSVEKSGARMIELRGRIEF
jgi:hypothetical protein